MKYHKNIYIWLATTALSHAAFTLPVWFIFNTEQLGLNNTLAFILGVFPYGLSALFEVPTGSWADKYGRAKVFQMGMILYALGISSYLFTSSFVVIMMFQVLSALGIAMKSGCIEALVHDSLPEKDKDKTYASLQGKNMVALFAGRVVTVLSGGVMYAVNPKLPFVALLLCLALGLGVSLMFFEVRAESPTELSSYNHIRQTFSLMLNVPIIVTLMSLLLLYRFSSEALFSIYQPYLKSLDININSFGIFYAAISMLSGFGALMLSRVANKISVFKILLLMMSAILFTFTGMLVRVPWLTYIIIIPSSIAFGCAIIIQNTSIQRVIGSRHQATALSIASLMNTAFFFMATVSVGVSLDYLPVNKVNMLYTAVTAIFMIPFITNLRNDIKSKVI